MGLHFSAQEFQHRREAVCRLLRERNLDGMLMFRQESMYYLTGYDTFGYCFFQCLAMNADGRLVLFTRAPDLRQARHTSDIEDIRIWVDGADANPAEQLRPVLDELGFKQARVGVEYEAYGLTAANGKRLDAALQGYCKMEDASDLVSILRLVKSSAELEYARTAAELGDRALDKAASLAAPGADEAEILGAMQAEIFRGGGDYPGNEFIIGSGPGALLCRYFSGRRRLDSRDQLTIEFAGVYRHYHAALMRTILVGEVHPAQREMHAACREALEACMQALKPGRPMGEVFDAHARVLDQRGYAAHRMNACGYSLGATFTPTWMDWPMFFSANPQTAQPNMVFFLHMILMDSDRGRAMSLGHTVVVTETGCQSLSRASLDLICK